MTRTDAPPTRESRALAAELAGAIHHEFEDAFSIPVRTSAVAKRMGIIVEQRDQLVERARLVGDRIVIRRGLSPAVGRFVLAHEIGHAVLRQRRPEVSATWSVPDEEKFADWFATELLFPPDCRGNARMDFVAAQSPTDLTALASQFGVTPHCLLAFASRQRWHDSSWRIWLRLKYSVHDQTRRDIRLRIISIHCDQDKFYLPKNRSIRTAIPTLPLTTLSIGRDHDFGPHAVSLQLVNKTTFPKYRDAVVPASVRCLRLCPSADEKSYYLTMLDVQSA